MRARHDREPGFSQWLLGALTALVVLVSLPAGAWAQSCDALPGSVLSTFPASNSRGVPLNGLAIVEYCPTEVPLVDPLQSRLLKDLGAGGDRCECGPGQECLEVARQPRCLSEVLAAVEVDEEMVLLQSSELLEPNQSYVIEAPEPTGMVRIGFTTSDQVDEAPPQFSGIRVLEVIGCGEGFPTNAACPQNLEEDGFVAIVTADAASDEVGAVNIEYRVYQVRGEELIERGQARGDGVSDVTMSVVVAGSALEQAEWERICFVMGALDPYGHERLIEQPVCANTPEYSPFGSACAVSPHPGQSPLLPALLLLALVGLRASSTGSRRRRSSPPAQTR